MIETQDLSKCFDNLWAVDGVTLTVQPGELLTLLGPNGAGKTTTMRMLTSVLRPSRGSARIAGYDVVSQAEKVRAHVGVLTEQHGLYGRMPAGEYLEFFAQLYGLPASSRRQRAQFLLESFGLINDWQRKLAEFSKGMRQKLALARALVHDPPVLLLDEPTSAMDPESARLVRDTIRQLRSEQRAIIVCTHNLAEAEELADQIAIIRQGKIIIFGSPQELKLQLLGAAEYELRLAAPFNGRVPSFPQGVQLTTQGNDWLRFRADEPERTNPQLLNIMLQDGFAVVSLQEVTRNLEQVYLQAVHNDKPEEKFDG